MTIHRPNTFKYFNKKYNKNLLIHIAMFLPLDFINIVYLQALY